MAADSNNVHLVGALVGGNPWAVSLQGNYAYVAADGVLSIMDISNPAHPVQAAYYAVGARDAAVSGDYAYVVSRTSMSVVNVSNPTSPYQAGYCDLLGDLGYGPSAHSITLSGNYAYVAAGFTGLQVIDISNPASPAVVGRYGSGTEGTSAYVDVAVSGNYAYVAAEMAGMYVIDISNPLSPSEVGHFENPFSFHSEGAQGVAANGNHAYLVDYWEGLRVIDVSNPTAPTQTGICTIVAGSTHVVVREDFAFVAARAGLSVINISNPVVPMVVGSFSDHLYWSFGVDVSGNYAFLADYYQGLRAIDISNPSLPAEVGFFTTPGSACSIAKSGAYSCAADYNGGMHVMDVSNPALPVDRGYIDGVIIDLAMNGSYVYAADDMNGFRVISISDPALPTSVGQISMSGFSAQLPGSVQNIALSGNYAYVTNGSLRVIDVSNPASPAEAGHCDTPGSAHGVAVKGDYAYVTDGALEIISISNPSFPFVVGHVDTSGSSQGVAVNGEYAFVLDGTTLRTINISDPFMPFETGQCTLPQTANQIVVSGNYAYVADGDLRVFDISDPAAPFEAGYYQTPADARSLVLDGNDIYVADFLAGLEVFHFIPSTPTPSATATVSPTVTLTPTPTITATETPTPAETPTATFTPFATPDYGEPVVWETPQIVGYGSSRALCHAYFTEAGKEKLIVGMRVDAGGPCLDIWSFDSVTRTWAKEQTITDPGWDDPHDIAAADLNKDGKTDIAVTMRWEGPWVLISQGGGNWTKTRLIHPYGNTIQIADVDQDGNLDIVHSPGGTQLYWYARVFYGDGLGNFANGGGPACPQTPAGCVFDLIDINHDGLLDLIGASIELNGPEILSCLRAYLNLGSRAWSASLVASDAIRIGNGFKRSAGDVNQDGYADYVAYDNTNPPPYQLAFLNGAKPAGDYIWNQQNYGPAYAGSFPGAVFKEINGDGHLDVLVAGGNAFSGIKLYYGDGQGQFSAPQELATVYTVWALDAEGDYNGDGLTDIAFSTDSGNGFGVIFGARNAATPSSTVTVTCSATITPTNTSVPTGTPTCTATGTEIDTATVTATETTSATATCTETPTWTSTETPTETETYTVTATATPTVTLTPTSTDTATITTTCTPVATATPPTPQQVIAWPSISIFMRQGHTQKIFALSSYHGTPQPNVLIHYRVVFGSGTFGGSQDAFAYTGPAGQPAGADFTAGGLQIARVNILQIDNQGLGGVTYLPIIVVPWWWVWAAAVEQPNETPTDNMNFSTQEEAQAAGEQWLNEAQASLHLPDTATETPTATPTSTLVMPTLTATGTSTPMPTSTPFVKAQTVVVYPQPARGQVNFAYTLSGQATVKIDIYRLTGERVASISETVNGGAGQTLATVWQAANVAPGIYLCRIKITDAEGKVVLDQKKKVALIR
ncbi:MAG: FG-GAP-like repeat-containing protein [candidate division FCPU426 bacterium]